MCVERNQSKASSRKDTAPRNKLPTTIPNDVPQFTKGRKDEAT